MQKGKFISLEGTEGVGKTTQMDFICRFFAQRGHAVVRTREPGGTPLAERIRDLLLNCDEHEPMAMDTELLLLFAARAQHIQQVIKPGLAQGFVITDRFTDASYAYQSAGRGAPPERIKLLEDWVQQGLQPDVVFLLDAPVAVGRKRANKRGRLDRIEREQNAFFERVRQGYLQRAQQDSERYRIIDASVDITQVQAQISSQLAIMYG